ncbi:MAG: chemotaxis protein CheB [Ruminococcus sp.]|nr:chemotaxis protein CheB [Ruminococcus sp.]
MKILLISDNTRLRGMLSIGLTDSIDPRPLVTACALMNGRTQLLTDKPTVAVVDIDGDKDPESYIMNLAPKYYVPIVAVTKSTGDMSSLIRAGAVDIISRRSGQAGDERLLQRLTVSIRNIARSVSGKNELQSSVKRDEKKIIAIGGSTGSTNALPVLLRGLRPDCPPVVCVLHMPMGYTKLYAQQLNQSLPLEVKEAVSGTYPKNGQVIIAEGSKHLRVFKDSKGYFITSETGEKVNGHCPSVSVLFDSVAYAARGSGIGVILTGMGADGAEGMLNMRKMGAFNIAESESTAVVYGMPKAAVDADAVNVIKPLHDIAAEINKRI